MKKVYSLLVVLLAFGLAACAPQGIGQSASSGSAVSVGQLSLPGVSGEHVTAMVPVEAFPSAPVSTALGKAWQTMHANGNKADVDTNCRLLGLNVGQCIRFKRMINNNECADAVLPNGVVLDRLTFTRENPRTKKEEHVVQEHVRVAIGNVPEGHSDRGTKVCLIDGMYIGQFNGCKNFWRVDARGQRPVVASPPLQVSATGACVASMRGHFRLCLQAFQPVGDANKLWCEAQDSRNLSPDHLRKTVPLDTRHVIMHIALKEANAAGKPLGMKVQVPLSSGGTATLTLIKKEGDKGDFLGEFPFAGEVALYIPPSLGRKGMGAAVWSENPAYVAGYPQACDCLPDGYGDKNTGALRIRAQDNLGEKVLSGSGRGVLSFRVGTI
ncbi:hypothetical protein K8Q93_03650 [Candidatus Parcubacteria bacterium]|nr:hypothetical protein [Candidatus Parcubacteria bacterium]